MSSTVTYQLPKTATQFTNRLRSFGEHLVRYLQTNHGLKLENSLPADQAIGYVIDSEIVRHFRLQETKQT